MTWSQPLIGLANSDSLDILHEPGLCDGMQILAIKQAAATKARCGAGQTARKMKHFLLRLREEYGWPQPHMIKKQRC